MSNPMKDYVDNFRANLPNGVTYDSGIARYFVNNKRFLNEWEVERYLDYITKFGFVASPITATVQPSLGTLVDGDAVQDAYTAGSGYSSTEGTIGTITTVVTINGTTGALTDIVSYQDSVVVVVTVTDSAGNSRDFSTGTQTVAGIAPTADTAPTITGTVAPGETVTINEGTYSGVPAPTITGTLMLNGAEVSFDTGTNYTLPADTEGQVLEWSEVASNGITPDAEQSVSETVQSASAFLLDNYPGAAAAWSLRQLKSGVTNVVRVRRSSDDAEQDFTATEVSDGTLLSFVGANDGFQVTRYDQTGNGEHDTQSDAAKQPRLVNSGSFETLFGEPCAQYDGVDDFTSTGAQLLTTNEWHIFCLFDNMDPIPGSVVLSQHLLGATGRVMFLRDSNDLVGIFLNNGNSFNSESSFLTASPQLSESRATGNDYAIAQDGSAFETVISGQSLTPLNEPFRTGASDGGAGGHWEGLIGETIIFPSNQTTNRSGINSDIATYYGITLA